MNLPKSHQENILALLVFDDEAAKLIRNSVEESVYDAPFYRTIAAKAYAYIDKYQSAPKEHIADELDDQLHSEHEASYKEILHSLYNTRESSFNSKYVLDTLVTFLRKKKFERGLILAANTIQSEDDLENAYSIMQGAMEYNLTLFDPGIRLSELNKGFLLTEEEEAFPTGIKELDERGLGPARGQLISLAATKKAGKSWFLIHLGKMALMTNAKICHITLEISAKNIYRRYIQSLFACTKRPAGLLARERLLRDEFGRTLPDFAQEIIGERPSLEDDKIISLLKEKFKLYGSKLDNLIIKEFPSGTLTTIGIEAYLDSLYQQQGFIPDLLLIDYINLMKVRDRSPEEFIQLYTNIRGIAGKRNVAVATVAQINREGSKLSNPSSEFLAEAFGTAGVVDTQFIFSQTPFEYSKNLAQFFVADTRVGDENKFRILLEQDYKIGQFCVRSDLWPKWYKERTAIAPATTPTPTDSDEEQENKMSGDAFISDKKKVTNLNLGDKSGFMDVDDVVTRHDDRQQQSVKASKLQHANEVAAKTSMELRTLCEGLNSRVMEIGLVVSKANQYQGSEVLLSWLGKWGKDKADVLRHDRLQALNLDQAVKEIEHYVAQTISQLGESEAEYKLDLTSYQQKLDEILVKNREATPAYIQVKATREKLEAEVNDLEEELKAGTVAQADRPAKEELYESKKRQLDAAKLSETTAMAVVKEAQEALPELQKNRDSAASAIQSLHGMRQSMLEKFTNFKVVLERATTAMKARARLELYESTDPALNKSLELITENNVATAGAAMDVMVSGIQKAAIDPEKSQELLNELLANISDCAKGMAEIEGGVEKGTRVHAVK